MPYKIGLPPIEYKSLQPTGASLSPKLPVIPVMSGDKGPEIAQDDLAAVRAWIVVEVRGENRELRAVLVCSALLEDHLWVIWDRSFQPKDNLAIYYGEEILSLKDKSLEDLREIHKVKLIFPGCRVIQEGPEGQREGRGNALPKLETLNPKR